MSLGIHNPLLFQRIDMVGEVVLTIHLSKNSEPGLGVEFLILTFGAERGGNVVFLYIVSTRIGFIRES